MKKLIVTLLAALALIVSAPASGYVAQTSVDIGPGGSGPGCMHFSWNAFYPGSPYGVWCWQNSTPGWWYWVG